MARILVVEDNEENRDSLSRRLQRRGFEVLTAADGKLGVAAAKAENDANTKALYTLLCKDFKFSLTMDEVYAQVDKGTSLQQLVAELEAEATNT